MNKTNIIYIFADQWRRQSTGFMGEDSVITPNIDDFSKDCTVFENAVSCFPVSSPHRASILSGQYPMNHGVITNCKPGLNIKLKSNIPTIGKILKDSGYNTGYIGKWHLDEPEINHFKNPESGAKEWDAYTPPGPKRQGFDFWYSYGAWDSHLKPHYWKNDNRKIVVDKWSVEHETDIAIDFIEERKNREPFALFLSWNPPHTPFDQVPDKYRSIYKEIDIQLRANVKGKRFKSYGCGKYNSGDYAKEDDNLVRYTKDYFSAVTGIDDNFGRIIEYLKREKLYDKTIIILSSDHGEMLGSHGLMNKLYWYEESIGIPFLIRDGERSRSGKINTVLNTVDHMPTILGLLGLECPNGVDGEDLSGLIRGNCNSFENKDAFLTACYGRKEDLGKGIPEELLKKTGWRAIRTKRYTYVVKLSRGVKVKLKRLLYDNIEDRYQLNPKLIKNSNDCEISRELERRLKEKLLVTNDPFPID